MHAVSRRDDPFASQQRASAVVLGALVHADLPGPAPGGHVSPPNHPHSTGVQPALCKAAGEHASGEAPGARPSGWRVREAKKLLDPGGGLGDTGEGHSPEHFRATIRPDSQPLLRRNKPLVRIHMNRNPWGIRELQGSCSSPQRGRLLHKTRTVFCVLKPERKASGFFSPASKLCFPQTCPYLTCHMSSGLPSWGGLT